LKGKKQEDKIAEVNRAYIKQVNAETVLLDTLRNAPVSDTVELVVTKFVNVCTVSKTFPLGKDGKRKSRVYFLTSHRTRVNNVSYKQMDKYWHKLEKLKNIARVVAVTVADEQGKDEAEKARKNWKPKYTYCPVGIAFRRREKKGSYEAITIGRDIESAKVYFVEGKMYFALDPKFKVLDLANYAVIIQRTNDGEVGLIDPQYPHLPS